MDFYKGSPAGLRETAKSSVWRILHTVQTAYIFEAGTYDQEES